MNQERISMQGGEAGGPVHRSLWHGWKKSADSGSNNKTPLRRRRRCLQIHYLSRRYEGGCGTGVSNPNTKVGFQGGVK